MSARKQKLREDLANAFLAQDRATTALRMAQRELQLICEALQRDSDGGDCAVVGPDGRWLENLGNTVRGAL